MHIESHLENDFPSMRAEIRALRTSDAAFALLATRYDDVNREVVLLEERNVPMGDVTFEDLKKERVRLKDEIYSMLETRTR